MRLLRALIWRRRRTPGGSPGGPGATDMTWNGAAMTWGGQTMTWS